MNLFTCKARVISAPRLFLYKQKALVQMLVCLPNFKKGYLWYYMHTKTHGKLAHQVFDICSKGNFVFLHGHIKIKLQKVDMSKKNFKTKKILLLYIKKIYPVIVNK